MNVNVYLEDSLGHNLDNISKEIGKSRNFIIREAIKEWLENHSQTNHWPELILNFKGVPDFPAFESYRNELIDPHDEAF
ncbi:MAG: ribbon-helix-helix domain-containing protein [Bdellovibrionota bacterium]